MPTETFILDASVTVSWALPDEDKEYCRQVLRSLIPTKAFAPAIWLFEVGNALLAAERRGRLNQEDITQFLSFLWQLPIEVEVKQTEQLPGESLAILSLARLHQLSVYDAAYLHLAMYHGCPLATTDAAMRQAAGRAGVPLFGAQD